MIIEHEANPSWSASASATAPASPLPRSSGKTPTDEVEALLRRYPLLNEAELQRCIDFIAKAPIAERGALSSRPGMADKMNQLRADHPKPFRPSLASYAMFGVLIVAIIVSGFLMAG